MTNTPQEPIQTHWNDNEFGPQPYLTSEILNSDFSKNFAHLFVRDVLNQIWRSVKSDTTGNLKTSNGTQNAIRPAFTTIAVLNAQTLILANNPNRRAFWVMNDGLVNQITKNAITIILGAGPSAAQFSLPCGFMLIDDTWSGDVIGQVSSASQTIAVFEFA